jgi:hypothetical protein
VKFRVSGDSPKAKRFPRLDLYNGYASRLRRSASSSAGVWATQKARGLSTPESTSLAATRQRLQKKLGPLSAALAVNWGLATLMIDQLT